MRQNVSDENFICSNQIAIVPEHVGCDIKRHSSVISSAHSLMNVLVSILLLNFQVFVEEYVCSGLNHRSR